jgi:ABC-type antimicrobial peptide transport system permease subunit
MAKITVIKRIPPVPMAIAIGLINFVVGLLLGIVNMINTLTINSAILDIIREYSGLSATNILSKLISNQVWMIIAFPISGFVVGFLGTLVIAWIYNMVGKKNPIKLELK